MSEKEERAAIAETVLKYEETKKALALRKVVARDWAAALEEIANRLHINPSDIFFSGKPKSPSAIKTLVRPDDFDFSKLKALIEEIQELEEKLKLLEEQKKSIGF